MEYGINKGIGKSVEFRGLKAQYLFIFAGGLLAVFVVFVILYMAGVDQWVCIAFGVAAASVLVWLTFRLNTRYGEHGLMKLLAARPVSYTHLLAVEGGCIISKDADITVVYRVELPELFTVTSAEYEAIHAAWCKALKVLPEYSVVHKQDWVRHDVV